LDEAITRNVGTFGVNANRKSTKWTEPQGRTYGGDTKGGALRSSKEVRESGRSEGGACSEARFVRPTRNGRSPKDEAKPYCIFTNEKFDFLGFTFRPRAAVNRKGKVFCSFSPAISKKAVKKISDEIRQWQLHRRTASSIEDLAKMLNPKLRGWFNYYGRFNPSALRPLERHVGQSLVRWACRKYKKLRGYRVQAWGWLVRLIERQPTLLALWERQRSEVFTMGAV
jgi:Group II intron, maturase-specific domain